MKIYLFHPETGYYLGEDFADELPMKRGASVVPPDATTIAPPPVGHGRVAVFDLSEQRWKMYPYPPVAGRAPLPLMRPE